VHGEKARGHFLSVGEFTLVLPSGHEFSMASREEVLADLARLPQAPVVTPEELFSVIGDNPAVLTQACRPSTGHLEWS
jgi:hypothetical protein